MTHIFFLSLSLSLFHQQSVHCCKRNKVVFRCCWVISCSSVDIFVGGLIVTVLVKKAISSDVCVPDRNCFEIEVDSRDIVESPTAALMKSVLCKRASEGQIKLDCGIF